MRRGSHTDRGVRARATPRAPRVDRFGTARVARGTAEFGDRGSRRPDLARAQRALATREGLRQCGRHDGAGHLRARMGSHFRPSFRPLAHASAVGSQLRTSAAETYFKRLPTSVVYFISPSSTRIGQKPVTIACHTFMKKFPETDKLHFSHIILGGIDFRESRSYNPSYQSAASFVTRCHRVYRTSKKRPRAVWIKNEKTTRYELPGTTNGASEA
jgi:hypothetical protein